MTIDIHTHRPFLSKADIAVCQTPSPTDRLSDEDTAGAVFVSCGIHPWDVSPDGWEQQLQTLRADIAACKQRGQHVAAIGECGLDTMRGPAPDTQQQCFEAQLRIAAEMRLPVIIHIVKAFDRLMAVKDLMDRSGATPPAWIIHGFRGKPQQALQLMRHGFDLSFGPHFNPDSLREAWFQRRMWLETDDSGLPIQEVYLRAATALSLSPEDITVPAMQFLS